MSRLPQRSGRGERRSARRCDSGGPIEADAGSGALVRLLAVLGGVSLAFLGTGLGAQTSGLVLLLALLLLRLTLVPKVVAAAQAAGGFLELALGLIECTHAI